MEGRSHHRYRIIAALACASFLTSTLAARPAAAEPLEAEASALFKRGVAALQKNSFALAVDMFKRSYELNPKAATICNLAITYDRWPGHEADALTAYRTCAEDDRSGRFRDHALERSRTLRTQIPQPDPEPEPVPEPVHQPPRQPEPVPTPLPPPPRPIQLAPPILVPVQPAKRESRHRLLISGGIITGLGVVLLAAGIGTNVKSNQAIDQLNPFVVELDDGSLEIPGDKQSLYDSAVNNQRAAKALYGTGGVVTAAGVTMMIVGAAIDF